MSITVPFAMAKRGMGMGRFAHFSPNLLLISQQFRKIIRAYFVLTEFMTSLTVGKQLRLTVRAKCRYGVLPIGR